MTEKSLHELNIELHALHDDMDAHLEDCKKPDVFASYEDAMDAYYLINNKIGELIPKVISATLKERSRR